GSLPPVIGEDPAQVARLDVWLSSVALDRITVIDTPGLASLTGASRPTEEFLALDAESRSAVSEADALLFVMSGELHQDDVAVLDAFRNLMAGTRASTVNAIGVLNKVDLIGGGAVDAVAIGQERAAKLARVLRTSLATVVPMIGLQAETTETGALSANHIRALTDLAAMDEMERELLLISVDRFTTSPAPLPVPVRAELLARLDITGVRRVVSSLAGGADVAEALADLRTNSGLARLRTSITELFANPADALKAEWGLATLERLSERWGHRELPGRLEEVASDPGMHAVQELRALQLATTEDLPLPEPFMDELRRLVTNITLRGRLGLTSAASVSECQQAAADGSRRWADAANSGQGGAALRRVARVVRRSYDLMWQAAATTQEAAV
ncbi:MAG TPA: GTPase domain-containing protein, partial [Acidimicrobiales bacterium]|nr:GTPase domain-containing protein [Acidimicrobiales bacterium]